MLFRNSRMKECEFAIINSKWSMNSWPSQAPFFGPGDVFVSEMLKEVGLDYRKGYFTAAGMDVKTSTKFQVKEMPDLQQEILELHPKAVLVFGDAADILLGRYVNVEKDKGRILWSHTLQTFVVITINPGTLMHVPAMFNSFKSDFIKFSRAIQLPRGPVKLEEPITKVIYDNEDYQKYMQDICNPKDNVISVDIETEGFNHHSDKVLSIGLTVSDRATYIFSEEFVNAKENQKMLDTLLSRPEIVYVYQNGLFDVKFLRTPSDEKHFKVKKTCVLPHVRCDFDTMLAHYCCDETPNTHGLKVWAADEFDAPDWDAPLKQYLPTKNVSYGAIPRPILYKYQGYDCYYTRKGYYLFLERMKKENTLDVFKKVYMPAVEAFVQIEMKGCRINLTQLRGLYAESIPRIQEATKELQLAAVKAGWDPVEYANVRSEERLKDWKKKVASGKKAPLTPPKPSEVPTEFNPKSHPQLSYVAYDLCKMKLFEGKKTCNKDAVDEYKDLNPFWKAIAEYKSVTDIFGTFIKGMLERTQPDEHIYPDFLLHGTRTGRISCQDPNLQNLPRGSIVKDVFIPEDDCCIVNADYKTLEVVVASILSNDKAMQLPFIEHRDFHTATAMDVYGEEIHSLQEAVKNQNVFPFKKLLDTNMMLEVRERVNTLLSEGDFEHAYDETFGHLRFLTKFITFGIMYGRQEDSLAHGELNCSVSQARMYMKRFFEKYKDYTTWLNSQFQHAKQYGYVTNAFGFKRHWPLITRENEHKVKNQSWNTPVQGTASMICMQALTRLQKKLVDEGYGRVLFTVHDSIVCNVKKEVLKDACDLIYSEMTKQILPTPVPLEAELEIGMSYKKVKGLDRKDGIWIPSKDVIPELAQLF